jgi:Protein of unknown function (DUF3726)
MLCSLNEIEAQLRKAARGAGLPWGLAEEAGNAARWLAMHGIGCLPIVAALLEENDGRRYDELAIERAEGTWRARGGTLCPLTAGPAIVDRADEIAGGRTVVMEGVAWPVLLAPFAAATAAATGASIALAWPGARFTFANGCVRLAAALDATEAACAVRATCGSFVGAGHGRLVKAGSAGVVVDDLAWSRLDVFVQRTYVPASEESRLKGAGAGLLDID